MSPSRFRRAIRDTVAAVAPVALLGGCFHYVPVTVDDIAARRIGHHRARVTTTTGVIELSTPNFDGSLLRGRVSS